MKPVLRRPSSRFMLSVLLAWVVAALGLFSAGHWSSALTGRECQSLTVAATTVPSTETTLSAPERDGDDTPSNAPSLSDEREEQVESVLILASHPSPELNPVKLGKVVWHRSRLLEPSSVGRKPAYEPPAPLHRLG